MSEPVAAPDEVEVEIDPRIFNDVYIPHLHNNSRTQILFGGSASGKSVFFSQRCVIDVMAGGRNYLICRAVSRTIRRSVFNEIKKVISDFGVQSLFNINKSESIITCENGYQILFTGLDDVEKTKSITPEKGAITDIWIEEATEIERNTIRDLRKRQRGGDDSVTKRLTLSFNPILQSHHLYQEFFSAIAWADTQTEYKSETLSILKTTYLDNSFLTVDDRADLENETDPYYHDVYTLGKWGVLGNAIFKNWRVEDLSQRHDQFTNRRIGLDFGFSSNPAALPVTHYDLERKTIYIFDELYERGLTKDLLADEIKLMIGRDPIVGDSAEPKSIAELQKYGLNIRGATKGKDSIMHGIQWLQQQIIIIDSTCINARNEFQQYKWKEAKDGSAIQQPVDKGNHLIDALRYAYEDEMVSSGSLSDDQPKQKSRWADKDFSSPRRWRK